MISVSVVDGTGASVTTGFRYLVEEDTTDDVQPGIHSAAVPSLDVHNKIHSPVRASGHVPPPASSGVATVPDDVAGQPLKRYLVSILPDQDYTLSGAAVAGGQSAVTVIVQKQPIKTAQISVYAFHDNKPLNNAPDVPAEAPLAGFHVLVYDQLGNEMMDAFGNPLGTEYLLDAAGNYVPGPDGAPQVAMMGSGIILTSDGTNGLPAGEARVKNLVPGKYGIRLVPPAGEGLIQTSTLEGTPGVDAWVRAGEPPYFPEWGLASWHVFYGFIKATDFPGTMGPGVGTITGNVVYVHREPAAPATRRGARAPGPAVLGGAQQSRRRGRHGLRRAVQRRQQLRHRERPLQHVSARGLGRAARRHHRLPHGDRPATGGLIDLGRVPVFAWFGNLEGSIFFDTNGTRSAIPARAASAGWS